MIVDPRDVTEQRIGTPLRDAAVDPRPGDFLPPTNAGVEGPQGNPHGPTVVSPGLHAAETGGHTIRPGAVSNNAATQSDEETEHLLTQQPQAAGEEGDDPVAM